MATKCISSAAAVALFCTTYLALPNTALATSISPSVVVSNLQLAPSGATQTGALSVYFIAPPQLSVDVAGFQLSLSIDGPDDAVKFESVGAPQGKPYLFAPESTAPFASISPGGRRVTIGDFLNAGYGQARNDQGLAEVYVSISPTAAGKSYMVSVDIDPAESYLGVNSALLLPLTAQNGTISIVPEPRSLALAAIVILAAAHVRSVSARRAINFGSAYQC